MIAMAISCNPDVLIADEPTSALDVTVQSQIIDLLSEMQAQFGMAMNWITHDLGVVARTADRLVVVYAGQAVETGSVETSFTAPDAYTRGLLDALPRIDSAKPLAYIRGYPPSPTELPAAVASAPDATRLKRYFLKEPPDVPVGPHIWQDATSPR